MSTKRLRCVVAALVLSTVLLAPIGCGSDSTEPVAPGFIGGTSSNHQIGIVV